MRTTRCTIFGLLNLILLGFINQQGAAQCYVNAGPEKTFQCGDSVQLNGRISNFIPWASPTSNDLKSVHFTDETHGWAVGEYGTILKFNGTNWVDFPSPTSDEISDVFMIDSICGWACGMHQILKYDGVNWSIDATPSGSFLSICFSDTNTGWAGTYYDGLYKYDGTGWSSYPCPIGIIEDIFFLDSSHGWAVGEGSIIKYDGINWIVDTTFSSSYIISVHFTDSLHGWAVGGNGNNGNVIYRYDGTSWSFVSNPGYLSGLSSVFFTDNMHGWMMGGYGTIMQFVDSTLNFVPSPNGSSIKSVYFTDQNHGWAVGWGGAILKYNNFNCLWTPPIGLSNDTIPNPYCSPFDTTTYVLTAIFSDGCSSSDTVNVNIQKHYSPNICLVSIDSISNKNVIFWEKPIGIPIDTFNIYKETNITGIYEIIGEISFDSLSIFIDTSSTPQIKSASYKLSFIDFCGIETNLSSLHKTMHLNINQGMGNTWNLIWNDYEGFTVSSYNIYRGTQPNNLTLINTTTSGNTSFSDFSAPSGYVYYQIEVVCPNSCNPSKDNMSYFTSKSNIATNNPSSIIDLNANNPEFHIFPNPATNEIVIEIPQNKISNGTTCEIYNTNGQLIRKFEIKEMINKIDIKELNSGFYTINVKTDNGIMIKKIVKQ